MTDPTKPGPDADRIAELKREIAIVDEARMTTPSDTKRIGYEGRLMRLRAELSRLSNEQEGDQEAAQFDRAVAVLRNKQPELNERGEPMDAATIARGTAPSPTTSPEPQDVRATLEPFATFGTNPDGEDLTAGLMRDRICDWFGPADFRRARIALAALAQSDAQPREPDDTKVICPSCTHQFTAISVADQARLRAQSDAQPVGWEEAGRWEKSNDAYRVLDDAELARLERRVLAFGDERPAGQFNLGLKKLGQLLSTIRHYKTESANWERAAVSAEEQLIKNEQESTAPHSPDASGLIAAAEWLERRGNELGAPHQRSYAAAASALRARAADGSAPQSDRGGA